MKVILLQDVPKVGRKHEVKEVADGFGRNFLLARGKAAVATADILERIKMGEKAKVGQASLAGAQFASLIEELKVRPLTIKAKANEQGHLFAKIGATDLQQVISDQYHAPLEPKSVHLAEPIKSVGTHPFMLSYNKTTAEVAVTVEAL